MEYVALILPGLATKGKSARIIEGSLHRIREEGFDITTEKTDYVSHSGVCLEGFERDLVQMKRKIEALKLDHNRGKEIILVGICYGAYLASRYLQENINNGSSGIHSAVFIEPYFGKESFRFPYKSLAELLAFTSGIFPSPKFPLGKRGGKSKTLNLTSLAEFICQEADLSKVETPILGIATNYHHFFRRDKVLASLNQAKANYTVLDCANT
ncbi:MAG: hypothetical protein AABW80_01650 [Nanoarchaeota archaeon]